MKNSTTVQRNLWFNASSSISEGNEINSTKIILQCANGNRLHIRGEVILEVSPNAKYSETVSANGSDHLSHVFIFGTEFNDDLYKVHAW